MWPDVRLPPYWAALREDEPLVADSADMNQIIHQGLPPLMSFLAVPNSVQFSPCLSRNSFSHIGLSAIV
jgi:hypothetical protein